jgi:hypothetical protein
MPGFDHPAVYQITIAGQLKQHWNEWFDSLSVTQGLDCEQNPITMLQGTIPDQAALRGLLIKAWDLGLVVIALERIPAERPDNLQD